jgi:hypothetical protein
MNLLRATLAPITGGTRFFRSVVFSGSHRRSLELIGAGEADVAAIDCVTLEHLRRTHPLLISQVRVIDWTEPSPCLPFVITSQASESTVIALRAALQAVCADPASLRIAIPCCWRALTSHPTPHSAAYWSSSNKRSGGATPHCCERSPALTRLPLPRGSVWLLPRTARPRGPSPFHLSESRTVMP